MRTAGTPRIQGRLTRQENRTKGNIMAVWYYARGGERHGPHSAEELKRFATDGRLGLDDLVWTEGMPDWASASTIKTLFPDTALLSRPPPMPATAPAYEVVEDEPPQLWNPNAAANWSLLFSPAFGAWIHAKNWRTLNCHDKAQASMVWVYLGLALLVVAIFVPDRAARSISIAFLFGWYFNSAREQAKYVKSEFEGTYRKRGWGKPLGLALLALIAYVLVLIVVLPADEPDSDRPDSMERPL